MTRPDLLTSSHSFCIVEAQTTVRNHIEWIEQSCVRVIFPRRLSACICNWYNYASLCVIFIVHTEHIYIYREKKVVRIEWLHLPVFKKINSRRSYRRHLSSTLPPLCILSNVRLLEPPNKQPRRGNQSFSGKWVRKKPIVCAERTRHGRRQSVQHVFLCVSAMLSVRRNA